MEYDKNEIRAILGLQFLLPHFSQLSHVANCSLRIARISFLSCSIIITSYLSCSHASTTFSLLIIHYYFKIVAQKVIVLNFLTEYQWYPTMSRPIAITTCLFHLYLFSILGQTLSYSSPHMIHGRRFQTIQKALRSKRLLHNASKILSFITMPIPILPHSLWKKKVPKVSWK